MFQPITVHLQLVSIHGYIHVWSLSYSSSATIFTCFVVTRAFVETEANLTPLSFVGLCNCVSTNHCAFAASFGRIIFLFVNSKEAIYFICVKINEKV